MNLLALDLAMCVGWAQFAGPSWQRCPLVAAGIWRLQRSQDRHDGARWARLRALLGAVLTVSRFRPDAVAYERVEMRQVSNAAAHCYGAAEAYVLEWCHGLGVVPIRVPVSGAKRVALGKGGGRDTGKEQMLAAARARWPAHAFPTHDAADAAWIGVAALAKLAPVAAQTTLTLAPPQRVVPGMPVMRAGRRV